MKRVQTADRIARSAYRFWMKAEMTEWPTVQQVARRLRIRQSEIDECSGDGPYILTAYNSHPPQRLSEHYVEAMTPEVDAAWSAYYASRGLARVAT